ncbi:MAG: noncanonical pyrimidine nucleotidase, YjjG family [Bacteroidetes bacterium RBG_13_42_15]|nr:MAG: noncanonical pyrimidine nucleotidase, YjjG family [Bacteroidetes bacterium RBG_13_42_15]
MTEYNNIYFDLDNTLWDFEANARDAFREIFDLHHLWNTITDFEKFIETFSVYNEQLWEKYGLGQIKKEALRIERFSLMLHRLKISDNNLSRLISDAYLEIMPQKSNTIRYAFEVLEYLKPKYRLFILTNGFHKTQSAKLKNSGIQHYFSGIITSEDAHWSKPDRRIFEYALKSVNAKKSESLMVGDDLTVDILGAKNFGMDQVFFNRKMISHHMKITYEINQLNELIMIL